MSANVTIAKKRLNQNPVRYIHLKWNNGDKFQLVWEQPYTQTGLDDDTPTFTINDLKDLLEDAKESPFLASDADKAKVREQIEKILV
jgi:hypothetical protein